MKMKILVICQYYYPEPFRITDICESLVLRGNEVTVLTGLPNYPEGRVLDEYRHGNKRKEVINGVEVIRCFEIGRGKSKTKLFLNYLSYTLSATLKAIFIKEEFDVVFVNQLSPIFMGIPGIVYKKRHKKKLLLYCLDLWPDSLAAGGIKETSAIFKIVYKISKMVYSSADSILVTSSMFIDYFKNELKSEINNIKHLPQYAEDIFTETRSKAAYSRVKNERYNFVFAGNIGDMQSVETIIKAAYELFDHNDIFFHIVGDGSKFNECKKLTSELSLKNVKFYGRKPIEEMPAFYELADAMLITLKDNKTLSYTLPGKVQSYMAAGKPIIGAICGETQKVIEEAKCGFICKAEDYQALAKLILKFCDSDETILMGSNANKYYRENFDKNKFIDLLEKELMNLGA
ncbi:MAG: glycosyltransferase family 4 protein [Acidaminococcaceae bacterium]